MSTTEEFDPAAARAELSEKRGRVLWRSLEELSASGPFRQYVERENPSLLEHVADPIARRDLFRILGASVALAGFTACVRQPDEHIYPYAKNPEGILPGVPLFFASAMPWSTGGIGLLVQSTMGRPTKLDGNPEHPGSRGATDAFTQATILGMYDPDRSPNIRNGVQISTYSNFLAEIGLVLEEQKNKQGAGLRILTQTVTSPTLAAQLQEIATLYPKSRWHQYEPVNRDAARAGAVLAFGTDVAARHDYSKAKVVVALDADFLGHGPTSVADVKGFSQARRSRGNDLRINRLYAVESNYSVTGAMADHRVAVKPSELPAVAQALARALAVTFQGSSDSQVPAQSAEWIQAAARDLAANKGASVVVAGAWAPPAVHALAHAMNAALDNVGKTVVYTEPVEFAPVDHAASISALVSEMKAGSVELLVMLGGNPVYDAPAELDFLAALQKVPLRVHLSLYVDETSRWCQWHVNEAHYLEQWSDTRAYDGTVALVQPLIAPLYDGKSAHELVSALAGKPGITGHDLVQATWKQRLGETDFDKRWRKALHDGVVPDTASPAKSVSIQRISVPPTAPPAEGEIEVLFRPDGCAWDGRFVNNAWMQECPRPLTKLVWDNAAILSPATAKRLGVENGDMLEVKNGARTISAPAFVSPGEANDCITLTLGYGRTHAGRVGSDIGYDAYLLRTAEAPWLLRGAAVRRTGDRYELITAQMHGSMEGRDLVRVVDAGRPDAEHGHHEFPSLYKPFPYEGNQWAMVIDLGTCIGCNACSIACQAENNIPVVGKPQVKKNREMHWIRIDRYFEGAEANPQVRFQPVPCMQCENAPCELVCPVGATNHGPEGLNEMVYNRCVGTRYCSNNCPYKVRRFNFLLYQDWTTESIKLQRNVNVTVRSRGVMEKCTYCVQRINAARITATKQGRPIADGEIVTACQAVCPADAIVFGDKNNAESAVAKLQHEPLNYALLGDLNTRPRTTYLAKVENRGGELKD